MKYVTPILLALVILPTVALGGALWSQQNVTNTYETRIKAIDAEIEILTTREAELSIPTSCPEMCSRYETTYAAWMETQNQIAQLEEEKRILEVAYWLINTSFEN